MYTVQVTEVYYYVAWWGVDPGLARARVSTVTRLEPVIQALAS